MFITLLSGSVEVWANAVAEEERDAAAALLVECDLEGFGDGVFPRVVQAGEEDDEALLQTGWVALAKGLHHGAVVNSEQWSERHEDRSRCADSLVAEPVRDRRTRLQPPPQLRT